MNYSKAPNRWSTKMFESKPVPVSTIDPATGVVGETSGPTYDSPEAVAFWKPVFAGIRDRLLKRGIPESRIMVGIASDKVPHQDEVEMFSQVAPYAAWVHQAHSAVGRFERRPTAAGARQFVPVGYGAYVWSTRDVPDPAVRRYYGWQKPVINTVYPRAGAHPSTLFVNTPLGECWTLPEGALMSDSRGLGRIGGDFWPIRENTRTHDKGTIIGVYADGGQVALWESTVALLHPGPEGATPTIRLQAIHQGAQEAEARVFIERALADPALRTRLGDVLAQRCQQLLDERARTFNAYRLAWRWYPSSGWQARAAALFAAAGDVAQALRPRPG